MSALAELPPEVLEYVLSFLDGRSVIALRNLSKETQCLVDDALAGKIGQRFWFRRCLWEVPRVLVIKALASFQGIIGENARGQLLDQYSDDRALSHRWRRIYVLLQEFRRKFRGPVKVKPLTRAQNMLKNEVTIAFSKRNTSATNPYRMESTSGSTLFHVQCPCTSRGDQAHLYIFEDMTTYRRGIQLVGGKEKIRSVYTVVLPLGPNPTCLDPTLLKATVICVVATADHIILVPLGQGDGVQIIPILPDQYRNFPSIPTESRFGIWGDYIGVWLDPDTIRIYKICMDPDSGDLTLEPIKHIVVGQGGLHVFWVAVCSHPSYYLPVLRNDFQNPFKASHKSRIPVFSVLSPLTESFTVFDNGESRGAEDVEGQTEGRVARFWPKVNTENFFSQTGLRPGLFTRHKSEQNVVLFFNATWIAVLFANEIWIYQHLVPSPLAEPQEQLLDLECQTDNFFILGTNRNIYLTLFKYIPPSPIEMNNRTCWTRGQIQFEVIRKIPMNTFLPNPKLRLVHCHFDMDRGKPYIFLSFDLPLEERTAYTFELMKLEFETSREEWEEEFGHLKEENPWASDDFATPPNCSEMIQAVGGNSARMDALFRTFGIK